jgi:CBS domain-containing protein
MSPRAACRLEDLGFEDVYDFVAGKEAWFAEGLPAEGTRRDGDRVGHHLGPSPVTCGPAKTLGEARKAMARADDDECFVVTRWRIVLGRIRLRDIEGSPDDVAARDAMFDGPSTYRPNVPVAELAEVMRKKDLERLPITTASGRLLGVVRRDDLPADRS